MKTINLLLIILLAASSEGYALSDPKTYDNPEAAAKALQNAASEQDLRQLNKIFGASFVQEISSGDPIADKLLLQRLSDRMQQGQRLVKNDNKTVTIEAGYNQWTFPAPLVEKNGRWAFNTILGANEVANRRIGENELRVINLLGFYVEAQNLYRSKDRTGKGNSYARKIISTPGTKDGLYWPSSEGGASPFGPLIGQAKKEGYGNSTPGVYQGYHYRILTKQGAFAPGGAKNYLNKDGQMTGGFALIAYPVRWGVSGVMSFMVNDDGVIYQNNLGADTAKIGAQVQSFNPDRSWEKYEVAAF